MAVMMTPRTMPQHDHRLATDQNPGCPLNDPGLDDDERGPRVVNPVPVVAVRVGARVIRHKRRAETDRHADARLGRQGTSAEADEYGKHSECAFHGILLPRLLREDPCQGR